LRITPLDIYQQEFKRVLRGVDPDEVEDFLERVADDYEQIIKENAALKEQIESLKAQLAADGKMEQVGDLETATREEAANITREAKKEADNLIREARKEADNIIRKAEAIAREARESRVAESEEVGTKPEAGGILSEAAAREAD
jgi:cell division initiation protein